MGLYFIDVYLNLGKEYTKIRQGASEKGMWTLNFLLLIHISRKGTEFKPQKPYAENMFKQQAS